MLQIQDLIGQWALKLNQLILVEQELNHLVLLCE